MTRQARAVATRQMLLECAAEVFATVPYSEATISEVLRRADVTQGALYFHFKKKRDLAAAVIAEGLGQMSGLPFGEPREGSALLRLLELARAVAQLIDSSVIVAAALRLLTQTPHEFEEVDVDPFTLWAPIAEELLREAQRQGELADDADVSAAAWLFIANFLGSNEIVGFARGRLPRVDTIATSAGNLIELLRADRGRDA